MYVIEVELPDGFHWFGGIFINRIEVPLNRAINMPYNYWTPYEKEAVLFESEEQVMNAHKQMIEENSAKVVHTSKAKFDLQYIEISKNCFLGPKRQCYLKIGDKFKTEITAGYHFECNEISNGMAICRKISVYGNKEKGLRKKYTRKHEFSLKSKKFVLAIYQKEEKKQSQQLN